jgi:hypothetical protein
MPKRFMNNPEQLRVRAFEDFSHVLEQFVSNQLPINRIQELTRNYVTIDSDPSTWVSSTRKEGNMTHVRIGEQKLPENIARQFGWGVETLEQEYVVKVAHEYAHVIQEMFDQHLLRWLDGATDVTEEAIPYIQLYAVLAISGCLHGLPQMDIYHEQNKTTGNLSVPVYEDMAETIGSYLLGNDYFLYRIQNSHGRITQEQAEEIVQHVITVVSIWEAKSARQTNQE